MSCGSHNDRAAEITVIRFKPAKFKIKLEIYLKIANRLTYRN